MAPEQRCRGRRLGGLAASTKCNGAAVAAGMVAAQASRSVAPAGRRGASRRGGPSCLRGVVRDRVCRRHACTHCSTRSSSPPTWCSTCSTSPRDMASQWDRPRCGARPFRCPRVGPAVRVGYGGAVMLRGGTGQRPSCRRVRRRVRPRDRARPDRLRAVCPAAPACAVCVCARVADGAQPWLADRLRRPQGATVVLVALALAVPSVGEQRVARRIARATTPACSRLTGSRTACRGGRRSTRAARTTCACSWRASGCIGGISRKILAGSPAPICFRTG